MESLKKISFEHDLNFFVPEINDPVYSEADSGFEDFSSSDQISVATKTPPHQLSEDTHDTQGKIRQKPSSALRLPHIEDRPGHVTERSLSPSRVPQRKDKEVGKHGEVRERDKRRSAYTNSTTGSVFSKQLSSIKEGHSRKWISSTRPPHYINADRDLYRETTLVKELLQRQLRGRRAHGGESSEEYDTEEDVSGAKIHRFVSIGSPKHRRLAKFIEKDLVIADDLPMWTGTTKVTYMDYIASGRPLKCIESYIRFNVMPTYANTHTEVNYFAQQTTIMREEARSIIKKCINANQEDALIFTGSGATAAVHKLIHAMDIKKATVFVGPYEHHSNILPWKEINAKVVRIKLNRQGTVDMDHLHSELKNCEGKFSGMGERVLVGSFSAASNVTGILTDTNAISAAFHKYKGVVFFDYACAGPYVNIDMNPHGKKDCYKDAIFISPHKFVGGPQTPGILVAKTWIFRNRVPHGVGGGTVAFVTKKSHYYRKNLEEREEGGTPGIIESIRAGLVFKLKDAFGSDFIMEREDALFRLASGAWCYNPRLVILGPLKPDRLPIFPLMFYNEQTGRFVHHDFIALILNDVFGIQVRSGCACAAPYGMDILGIDDKTIRRLEDLIIDTDMYNDGESHTLDQRIQDQQENYQRNNVKTNSPGRSRKGSTVSAKNVIFKPGFVRLNFPFFISEECFDFVIRAIELVADKGWSLLPLYSFDRATGQWSFSDKTKHFHKKKSLKDITFVHGRFDVKKSSNVSSNPSNTGSNNLLLDSPSTSQRTNSMSQGSLCSSNYKEIIERAELIFEETMTPGKFIVPDQTAEYTGEADKLRWFMLPSEASNIINKKKIKPMKPEDRPILPAIRNMSTASDSVLKSLTERSVHSSASAYEDEADVSSTSSDYLIQK